MKKISDDICFELASGLEFIELEPEKVLLRSDFVALSIEGTASIEFVNKVLKTLQSPLSVKEICLLLPSYSSQSVKNQLSELYEAGVLVTPKTHKTDSSSNSNYISVLSEMGLDTSKIFERIGKCRIGIFGLEAQGVHLAKFLANIGVGELLLADPFPFESNHAALTCIRGVGQCSREEAVMKSLTSIGFSSKLITSQTALTKETVFKLAEKCDVLVGNFDRSFSSVNHWLNESAIKLLKPVIFGELRAISAFSGPFVLPEQNPCWMCYKMRALASEADFELAMAVEEHFDRKKQPELALRPIFPGLPETLALSLGMEILRFLIGHHPLTLVGRVSEYNSLNSKTTYHSVLHHPDCPVCGKKKDRITPTLAQLISNKESESNILALKESLVDPLTGIINNFSAVPKDPSEPNRPYIWRAKISNHLFLNEHEDAHSVCSGKGMSIEQAHISCLGEAIERYSSSCWSPDEVIYATMNELQNRVLNPSELALYLPEDYVHLPYSPFSTSSRLGWVQARSLTQDDILWVPAICVFMEYQITSQEEFLFPTTSNGLAAGKTLTDAVLGAIYEVIERDAFLISWLNRLPGKVYDATKHPSAEVRTLVNSYARRGVKICLVSLPTDHPVSVFAGLAVQEKWEWGGPAVTVGLGAHLDPQEAARQAAIEVAQVRPALRRRARVEDAKRLEELADDPMKVTSLEDHALIYAHKKYQSEFNFLFGECAEWHQPYPKVHAVEELQSLVNHFREKNQEICYVNLTSPDMENLNLYTARAMLPGFQPIWFGRAERRLANHRISSLPIKLGFNSTQLNPMPHPIA